MVGSVGHAQQMTTFSRVSCRACTVDWGAKYCVTPQGAYCDSICSEVALENRLDCLFASRRGELWFSGIVIASLIVLWWKLAKHCKSSGTTSTTAPPLPPQETARVLWTNPAPRLVDNSRAAPSVTSHVVASPELPDHDANNSDA
jgi:hypothetical protein